MTLTELSKRGWVLLGSGLLLVVVLLAVGRQVNGWLFGALLLIASALMIQSLRTLLSKKPHQIIGSLTILVLAFVLWDQMASQPRIRVEEVHLRQLPSSAQSGVVELVLRNAGGVGAEVVAVSAAQVSPLYTSARDLSRSRMEADFNRQLDKAAPIPATGALRVDEEGTARLSISVPFSERVWVYGRGESSVIVAAKIRYRDRFFSREKEFCQFTSLKSGQWLSCPFLNN